MPTISKRQTLLRWMFLAVGLLLLFGGNLPFRTVSENVSEMLYPDRPDAQRLFLNICATVNLLGATLSLITAWGIRRQRRWARGCGIAASLVLLVLFPLASLAGMLGLHLSMSQPLETSPVVARVQAAEKAALAKKSKDFWIAGRQSRWQGFVLGILGIAGFLALCAVSFYALQLKMTGWNLGWIFLPVFLLIDVTVHEFGHVAAAWALKNRLRTVNIGPFTFRDFGRGPQFHFDWRRLFHATGFVSSTPAPGPHFRARFIAQVAGGPAAAFLNGLVMACVFLALPDTRLQALWWFPGFLSVIAFFDVVMNLVPLGYSDGAMIFHLALLTRRGQALLSRIHAERSREESEALHNRAEFDKAEQVWTTALEDAAKGGEGNALLVASCHEYLARTKRAIGDWAGTEAESRTCLSFEAECACENSLAINAWAHLQRAAFARHRVLEVGRAYPPLLAALEEDRRKVGDRVESAVLRVMLGRAHIAAANFEKALEEALRAIEIIPAGNDRMILAAEAWSIRAQAEFALGRTLPSLESANQAAALLRSPQIPAERRTFAWHDLACLGADLFFQGDSQLAPQLIREAIPHLKNAGALDTCACHRIQLASICRELGDYRQAWDCLPAEDGLSAVRLRDLLAERARLHLASGSPETAVADCERLLQLWQSEPLEHAVVQALFAQAFLASGNADAARSLASQAIDVLGPARHVDAASALMTLGHMDEARNIIERDLLLSRASKDRRLKALKREPALA